MANPLRGQNNVQGARDMGALPNVLPGYQKVTDPAARAKFEKAWGVEKLNDILGEETADISPEDADALGTHDGEMIRVASRRGKLNVRAKITRQVPKGLVWMAFHFRENNANWLTIDGFDSISMTAEYKACAVRIEKQ